MIFAGGATLTIDDPCAGGSDAGAWAAAIAHTPHLAAMPDIEFVREASAPEIAHEGGTGFSPPVAPVPPTDAGDD